MRTIASLGLLGLIGMFGLRAAPRPNVLRLARMVDPATPDPRDIIAQRFDGRRVDQESSMNGSFDNNPEVNRLLGLASEKVSNAERFGLCREAERLVVAHAPWLFLGDRNLFLLRQPWIQGPVLEPFGCYRLDRAWRIP